MAPGSAADLQIDDGKYDDEEKATLEPAVKRHIPGTAIVSSAEASPLWL